MNARILKNLAVLLVSLVLIGGCKGIAVVDRNAAAPVAGEAIIVVGVNSPDYRLLLVDGTFEGEKFEESGGAPVINAAAEGGYVVARAKAGQVLGLTAVIEKKSGSAFATSFFACGGKPALAFEVPSGQVVYLADVAFQRSGNALQVLYSERSDAAARYVKANFPSLGMNMQTAHARLAPTATKCLQPQTLTIPIYVPR